MSRVLLAQLVATSLFIDHFTVLEFMTHYFHTVPLDGHLHAYSSTSFGPSRYSPLLRARLPPSILRRFHSRFEDLVFN